LVGWLVEWCKLSLYANDSCDERSLFLVMIGMMRHFDPVLALWQ